MSPQRDVESALGAFLIEHGLDLQGGSLVGFSGGPDSMALLLALHALGVGPLRAVHVDHGLRPQAEREVELNLVVGTCASLGIPLTVAHVAPGAIERRAREEGEGVESAARAYRYHVFRMLLRREGNERIFLAHTRDDQLETILMRAFSGSSAAGMRGIPAISGPIVRPFLGLGKGDLLAYLARKGQSYSTDSTNGSDDYLRNRLRHSVIPSLDKAFPSWAAGLLATARKAGEDEAALASWTGRFGFRPDADGKGHRAGLALLAEPKAVQRRAFLAAASRLAPGGRISSRLADAAFEAIEGGASRYVGGGLELERRSDCLILRRSLDFPRDGGYFVMISGPVSEPFCVRLGSLRVEARWRVEDRAPGPLGIREGAFSFPLIVRSRRPGDALPIRGGSKPLDDLFAEWGLDAALRSKIPIIEDRDGIVAVLGSGFGYRDRYRPCGLIDGTAPSGGRNVADEGCRALCIKVKGA